MEKEEQERQEEIKRKLNLDYPIEAIVTAKQNSKEGNYVKQHQEAKERAATLAKINEDMKKKLRRAENEQEKSAEDLQLFKEKCESQAKQLEEKYFELQSEIERVKKEMHLRVEKEHSEREEEIQSIMKHG